MKDRLNKYLGLHFHKSITDTLNAVNVTKKLMQKNNANTFWKIRVEICDFLILAEYMYARVK